MLDEFICHFKGVRSILTLFTLFSKKIMLANTIDSEQTPQHVASDLGLYSFPMTLLRISRQGQEWVKVTVIISVVKIYEHKSP